MKKVVVFLKKYQLVIGLALIAGLVVSYKLLFPPSPVQPLPASPTPTSEPTPAGPPADEKIGRGITEEEFIGNILSQFPLSPYLPYPDNKIAVIRYLEPLKLEITVKQANNTVTRQKILDWIKEKGTNPQTHEIFWK